MRVHTTNSCIRNKFHELFTNADVKGFEGQLSLFVPNFLAPPPTPPPPPISGNRMKRERELFLHWNSNELLNTLSCQCIIHRRDCQLSKRQDQGLHFTSSCEQGHFPDPTGRRRNFQSQTEIFFFYCGENFFLTPIFFDLFVPTHKSLPLLSPNSPDLFVPNCVRILIYITTFDAPYSLPLPPYVHPPSTPQFAIFLEFWRFTLKNFFPMKEEIQFLCTQINSSQRFFSIKLPKFSTKNT